MLTRFKKHLLRFLIVIKPERDNLGNPAHRVKTHENPVWTLEGYIETHDPFQRFCSAFDTPLHVGWVLATEFGSSKRANITTGE